MTILWGKDSQGQVAELAHAAHLKRAYFAGSTPALPTTSGLSTAVSRGAQCETGEDGDARKAHGAGVEILHVSSPCNSPRVYSAWIDDFSDDLYLNAEPGYTPRSTFSERVAEIALCGFILLAVVCGLARWF